MNARFFIKHNVATLLAVIMIVIFGLVFATQLKMSLLPSMESPMAVVMAYYNGANPTDMEELVTRPLESAVMRVSGVKKITSTSSNGSTVIQITYVDGTDLDIAATRLREQFDMVTLPKDVRDPTIMNMNISDLMPTVLIALRGDDLNRLQNLADDVVTPALERIKGIASVTLYGGIQHQITVRLDSARAESYGLTTDYVSQFLSAENLIYPGGDLHSGTRTLTVSTDAKYSSVDDVRNTLITMPSGGTVRLGEVAQVNLENKDQNTIAKMSGQECVILMVTKQSGANEYGAAKDVVKRLEELAATNKDMDYYLAYDASQYIGESVNSALENIVLGVLLAAVVVFAFFRKLGPTMTIALSMPVCILTVFVLMSAFNVTMNMMSLGGIAMGVGMIVDNSIVVLENIYRFITEGKDRMTACVEGTHEVTNSVVASTLTTVAVFVPLGMTSGMAGMMFKDFCLTIVFLIVGSLLIALTLVPLLCYMMLNENEVRRQEMNKNKQSAGKSIFKGLHDRYIKILDFFAHHLLVGMGVCIAMVAVFLVTCSSTKMVLIPEMDEGRVQITASVPNGTSTQESLNISEQICAVVDREVPELKNYYCMISTGSGGMESMMSSGDVSVGVNLVKKNERERSATQIADMLRIKLQDVAGCEITVKASQASVSNTTDIAVEITGEDYETLSMLSEELSDIIEQFPDAVDVKSSVSERVPQVEITMNRQTASQYGLTAAQVGAAVRGELTGATATKVTINNKELDVMIKGDGAASKSLDALRSMKLNTAFGGTVPLSSVANVKMIQAPTSIERKNQTRQVKVTGDTISGDTTAMTSKIQEVLSGYPFPQGYSAETNGAFEDMMESFSNLLLALVVALGLVYFVLAAQFNSFLMPVIVMMILPVAFSGALFCLPLTGKDMSMVSLVSLIMLAGTVVNSSIILVDYINIRRDGGESREKAIVNACALRVRPVMMTTLTTVLAMIPMAAGIGDTSELMTDMGVTMMGGMIISTIVTLFFTPVFYAVIDNLINIFKKKEKPAAAPQA